jgi:hypothetical protein
MNRRFGDHQVVAGVNSFQEDWVLAVTDEPRPPARTNKNKEAAKRRVIAGWTHDRARPFLGSTDRPAGTNQARAAGELRRQLHQPEIANPWRRKVKPGNRLRE